MRLGVWFYEVRGVNGGHRAKTRSEGDYPGVGDRGGYVDSCVTTAAPIHAGVACEAGGKVASCLGWKRDSFWRALPRTVKAASALNEVLGLRFSEGSSLLDGARPVLGPVALRIYDGS